MSFEVKHLQKKFGEKQAVEDLSFELRQPGVYALLGTNGAGKSTSIRMMLGILAKDHGEVLLNGENFDTRKVNVGYLARREVFILNILLWISSCILLLLRDSLQM